MPDPPAHPGLRGWRRAADALEREHGLDLTTRQDFPQHLAGTSKKFVTKVVTVIGEQSYTWEARHHRRNRAQRHEVDAQPDLLPFAVFSKARIQAALSNPVKRVSFWVGPLFFLGSLLFVGGTASELDVGYWEGDWSRRMELAYVDGPFLAGAIAFFLGCYASFVEVNNVGVSEDWDDWDEGGRKGPPPAVTYAAVPSTLNHHMLSFYGVLAQYAGSVIFLIGSTTEVVHTTHPDLPEAAVTWLLLFPNLVGGTCFTLGAFLLAAEGSHSWWRGLLPPLRREGLRSANHWVGVMNWWGSALFMLAGVVGFLEGLSVREEIAAAATTWLTGSAIFVVQGGLLYLEIVNPAW